MESEPEELERQRNRLEWVLDALDSLHRPEHRKRLILEARAPEIAILTDEQAERLISALKLGPA